MTSTAPQLQVQHINTNELKASELNLRLIFSLSFFLIG